MALWRASANRVEEWARRQSLGSDSKKVRRRSRRVRFENVPHSGPADTPGSLCEREGGGKRRGVRKKKVESVGKDSRNPPGEAPGRPPPTRCVPIARTCSRKARSFAGFRFVSRSRSPPRPRGRRLTLVGLIALVVAFILTVLAGSCRARDRSLVVSSFGCVVGSLPLTDLGPRISF